MAVTTQMIESKEFKVVPKGYDPEDVDLFLDEIVDEMEGLQKEIKGLTAELDRARRSPQPAAPVAPPKNEVSGTVHGMLANAQRICDETIADAQKQAQDVVRDAQKEAGGIVRDARGEVERLNAEMSGLRTAVKEYRDRFRRLVQEQSRILDAQDDL